MFLVVIAIVKWNVFARLLKIKTTKMANNAVQLLVQRLVNKDKYSSSDSSSDDEWEAIVKTRGKRVLQPRVEDYARTIVSRYTDCEFKSHFRITRTTFDHLLGLLHADLIRKVKGCETIPAKEQLMIALWKMGTPDSYRSISSRFNVGKATALRAVRRVTDALFQLAPQIIRWPTGDEAVIVMRGFEEASAFPRVIGAIDGTHINIDAPNENANDYVNRKGHHSIHLQVVCDHRALIRHCYAGHPGSLHDQRVFRRSEVAGLLNNDDKFPMDSHLIGDAAYEIHPHLLVPFRDNGHLTARQNNFNYKLSSARTVVERCFALLKGRLRSLLHCLPMQTVDRMAEYIVACCVIHNICILQTDEFAVIAAARREEMDNAPVAEDINNQARLRGADKRRLLQDMLPMID